VARAASWAGLAVALAAAALALAAQAAGAGGGVLYIATDPQDLDYLNALLKGGYAPGGALSNLSGAARPDGYSVVVLLDPNWDPGQLGEALEASGSLVSYIARGGVVVATLNGAVLLNLTLASDGLPLRLTSTPGRPPAPASYNYSKYLAVEPPPGAVAVEAETRRGGFTIYKLRLGGGWLVVVPYNTVWAYEDTGDPSYLEVLSQAIAVAEGLPREEPRTSLGAALAVATATAAAAAALPASEGRARRLVAPLWARIRRGEERRHPARAAILEALEARGALAFSELQRATGIPKPTLSWHLYVLERAGLVATLRWRGRLYIYTPTREGEQALLRLLAGRRGFCREARACRSRAGGGGLCGIVERWWSLVGELCGE